MNVGLILLVIVLLSMAVEVLLGVKRGIALTGVRVFLWMLGTLVAALLAKKIAISIVMKVAASNSLQGATLAEVAAAALKGAGLGKLADVVCIPLAGLALSAAVPVVFVILFVIAKLITLGLYFVVKAIIKRSKAANVFTERPVWSKVAGGVVGGFVAVITCAIIASPASGLMRTVSESGSADSLFHIAKLTTGGKAVAGKVAELAPIKLAIKIEKNEVDGIGTIRVYAADDDATVVIEAESAIVDDIQEVYESVVDSPVEYVLKFTGAEAIAQAIYEGTSEVSPADIGVDDEEKQDVTYNFPATVADVMTITDAVDTAVTLINDGGGLTTELVDSFEEIINYALETDIVSDDDKLAMLNESVPMISEKINGALGLEAGTEILGTYNSIEDLKQDVGNIVEIAHVVAESDVIGSNGFQDVDVNALMNDTELLKSFVHSAMAISNGPSIIATIVNNKVTELSDGKINNPVSEASISNAGEDKVISTFTTLLDLQAYLGKTEFTDAERADIDAKASLIESYGVVSQTAIEEVKQWIENTK